MWKIKPTKSNEEVILINFAAAFDTINHFLHQILFNPKFSDNTISASSSYLSIYFQAPL